MTAHGFPAVADLRVHVGRGEVAAAVLKHSADEAAVRLTVRSEQGDSASIVLDRRQVAALREMLAGCTRALVAVAWGVE